MFQSELPLARVARVGLPEHGVPEPWHDLPCLQRGPDEVRELFFGGIVADRGPDFRQPNQHLQVN